MTAARFWWLADDEGATHGPFSLVELRAEAAARGLGPSARVWGDGALDWRPLAEVLPRGARGARWSHRLAIGLAAGIQFGALIVCALLVWAPAEMQPGTATLALIWPLAGWTLLAASVVSALLWLRAGRGASETGELRAIGSVVMVLTTICGLALAAFELHLEQPVIDNALGAESLNYDLHVDASRRRIEFVGSIGPGFGPAFAAALAKVGDPVTLVVASDGGLSQEALAAARALEARPGSTVVVRKVCASACLYLLMAGDERIADASASLDVHATAPLAETHNRLMLWSANNAGHAGDEYLIARGLPADMIAASNKVGADRVLTLSPRGALTTGVLTGIQRDGVRLNVDQIAALPPAPARRIRPASEPPSPWDD